MGYCRSLTQALNLNNALQQLQIDDKTLQGKPSTQQIMISNYKENKPHLSDNDVALHNYLAHNQKSYLLLVTLYLRITTNTLNSFHLLQNF